MLPTTNNNKKGKQTNTCNRPFVLFRDCTRTHTHTHIEHIAYTYDHIIESINRQHFGQVPSFPNSQKNPLSKYFPMKLCLTVDDLCHLQWTFYGFHHSYLSTGIGCHKTVSFFSDFTSISIEMFARRNSYGIIIIDFMNKKGFSGQIDTGYDSNNTFSIPTYHTF